MTSNNLAEFLLAMMPIAYVTMTVVSLSLAVILGRQSSSTPLGRWIVWLFVAITLMSLATANLMHYLYLIAEGDDITTWRTWSSVVGTAVVPFFVSFCGIKIAILDRRLSNATADDMSSQIEAEACQIEQHARDIGQTVRDARYDGKDDRA